MALPLSPRLPGSVLAWPFRRGHIDAGPLKRVLPVADDLPRSEEDGQEGDE
jgi:hypothetical protein